MAAVISSLRLCSNLTRGILVPTKLSSFSSQTRSPTHFTPIRHLNNPASSNIAATTRFQNDNADRIAKISSTIRIIPDFPKPGIMFHDITTLLLDHAAFKDTIDLFVERYKDMNISVVAGVEARGFIFGPPLALAIGAKFVPLRKPNRLPGEVISEEYSLEYGTDIMQMHLGAVQAGDQALVVDDLIATGGTLCAAMKLLGKQVTALTDKIDLTFTKVKGIPTSQSNTVSDYIFSEVDKHIESGDLISEYKMSALPSLYDHFVKLIKYLLDNKREDRDQVVILFQDMLEVVTRDIMMEDEDHISSSHVPTC